MGVKIPLSWMKCGSCGNPLTVEKGNEPNTVICASCGAINKIYVASSGGIEDGVM